MAEYPGHEKLKSLGGDNQIVGDFIEWLNAQGMCISELKRERGFGPDGAYVPTSKRRDTLLAEFFGIDEDELENEKRAMLDELRRAQS